MAQRDFSKLYNLHGLDAVLLTTDIDWAPDFAIEFMLSELDKIGVKLTAFATHGSGVLKQKIDWLEVGLHPDFTRVSGREDFAAKFDQLLEIYPTAKGTRSHRNLFGQNTCEIAMQKGIEYELSHVQFQVPWCQAFVDQWGLVRGSYSWEDGLHCDYKLPLEISAVDLSSPGLKIFNIHPVLFYLNCVTDQDRRKAVGHIRDLAAASKAEFDAHVVPGRGIRDLTLELFRELKSRSVIFYSGKEAFGRQ